MACSTYSCGAVVRCGSSGKACFLLKPLALAVSAGFCAYGYADCVNLYGWPTWETKTVDSDWEIENPAHICTNASHNIHVIGGTFTNAGTVQGVAELGEVGKPMISADAPESKVNNISGSRVITAASEAVPSSVTGIGARGNNTVVDNKGTLTVWGKTADSVTVNTAPKGILIYSKKDDSGNASAQNSGTIEVRSNKALGILVTEGEATNKKDGQITVSGDQSVGMKAAIKYVQEENAPDHSPTNAMLRNATVSNEGNISVTSKASGSYGMSTGDSNPAAPENKDVIAHAKNAGTITVDTSQPSHGMFNEEARGVLENSGTITVSGCNDSTGIALKGKGVFKNTGTITHSGADGVAVAIGGGTATEKPTVIFSGTSNITASEGKALKVVDSGYHDISIEGGTFDGELAGFGSAPDSGVNETLTIAPSDPVHIKSNISGFSTLAIQNPEGEKTSAKWQIDGWITGAGKLEADGITISDLHVSGEEVASSIDPKKESQLRFATGASALTVSEGATIEHLNIGAEAQIGELNVPSVTVSGTDWKVGTLTDTTSLSHGDNAIASLAVGTNVKTSGNKNELALKTDKKVAINGEGTISKLDIGQDAKLGDLTVPDVIVSGKGWKVGTLTDTTSLSYGGNAIESLAVGTNVSAPANPNELALLTDKEVAISGEGAISKLDIGQDAWIGDLTVTDVTVSGTGWKVGTLTDTTSLAHGVYAIDSLAVGTSVKSSGKSNELALITNNEVTVSGTGAISKLDIGKDAKLASLTVPEVTVSEAGGSTTGTIKGTTKLTVNAPVNIINVGQAGSESAAAGTLSFDTKQPLSIHGAGPVTTLNLYSSGQLGEVHSVEALNVQGAGFQAQNTENLTTLNLNASSTKVTDETQSSSSKNTLGLTFTPTTEMKVFTVNTASSSESLDIDMTHASKRPAMTLNFNATQGASKLRGNSKAGDQLYLQGKGASEVSGFAQIHMKASYNSSVFKSTKSSGLTVYSGKTLTIDPGQSLELKFYNQQGTVEATLDVKTSSSQPFIQAETVSLSPESLVKLKLTDAFKQGVDPSKEFILYSASASLTAPDKVAVSTDDMNIRYQASVGDKQVKLSYVGGETSKDLQSIGANNSSLQAMPMAMKAGDESDDWVGETLSDNDDPITLVSIEQVKLDSVGGETSKYPDIRNRILPLPAPADSGEQPLKRVVKNLQAIGANSSSVRTVAMAYQAGASLEKWIGDLISESAQDPGALKRIAREITPDNSGRAVAAAVAGAQLAASAIGGRQSGQRTGISSGDMLESGGFWLQYAYNDATQKLKDGVAGFESRLNGFTLGADTSVIDDIATVGLAYTYSKDDLSDKDGSHNSMKSDGHTFSLYGTWNEGPAFVDGRVGYEFRSNDAKRYTQGHLNKARYDTRTWDAGLLGGWRFPWAIDEKTEFTLQPQVAFHMANIKTDKYREKPSGSTAAILSYGAVKNDDFKIMEIGFGGKVIGDASMDKMMLKPEVSLMYFHNFKDDPITMTGRYAGGGSSFTVTGAKPAKNRYDFGLAANMGYDQNTTFTLSYNYGWMKKFHAHSFVAKAQYDF
ncbi:autotransporter outer membrane beta-barrel domain-containing protein [Sansalvadorimonas verongulae]|uniref:autotransporter outer membrane beta-barrel domain-containing protein n=1 Tax=Sansalvadorimonas verongulae TaxID=2172824 RepID=UPI0018AD2871|nr:autotransporter outer membrane beta-barrel domain-containing protein [Sansalvadorimonas verongulae]